MLSQISNYIILHKYLIISFFTNNSVKCHNFKKPTLMNTTHHHIRIIVSRKAQYKDVCGRTIEILQRSCIFKANCCLKFHNAHSKLGSGYISYIGLRCNILMHLSFCMRNENTCDRNTLTVFHKPSTMQEYCQLRFNCFVRN